MKRGLIILLLSLWAIISVAQLSVFSNYVQFNQKTKVYPIVSNGTFGLQLVTIGGKTFNIFLLDNKGRLKNSFEIKHDERNIKDYYGSFLVASDSILVLNFGSKNMDEHFQFLVDLTDGNVKVDKKSFYNSDNYYLASWEVPDSLYVLSIISNTNKLELRTYYSNKSEVKEFDIGEFFAKKDGNLYDVFNSEKGKPVKITNDIPVSLYLSSNKNKLYKNGDKIVLTLDYYVGLTTVIDLDISSGEVYYNEYWVENKGSTNLKTNSFLAFNKLFQLALGKDSLSLAIISTADKRHIGKFSAIKGRKVPFANTALVKQNEKQGFMYGHPEVKTLRSTKRFLKLAATMNPSLIVSKNLDNIQIKLGAVEEITQAGGVSASVMFSSGGVMEIGKGDYLMMPEPVYNFPSNYSFISYLSKRSVYFSSLVNQNTNKHTSGKISKFTYNFIEDYANLLPGNNSMVIIFKYQGDYYLGYYNKGSSTYNLEWFKNIDDHVIVY